MYIPGTKFKVVLRIQSRDQIFEPGLVGEIIEPITKMVGKAYRVKFEDGRNAERGQRKEDPYSKTCSNRDANRKCFWIWSRSGSRFH